MDNGIQTIKTLFINLHGNKLGISNLEAII